MRKEDEEMNERLIRLAVKFGRHSAEQKQIVISIVEKNLQKEARDVPDEARSSAVPGVDDGIL